jgi:hypothetical protein
VVCEQDVCEILLRERAALREGGAKGPAVRSLGLQEAAAAVQSVRSVRSSNRIFVVCELGSVDSGGHPVQVCHDVGAVWVQVGHAALGQRPQRLRSVPVLARPQMLRLGEGHQLRLGGEVLGEQATRKPIRHALPAASSGPLTLLRSGLDLLRGPEALLSTPYNRKLNVSKEHLNTFPGHRIATPFDYYLLF